MTKQVKEGFCKKCNEPLTEEDKEFSLRIQQQLTKQFEEEQKQQKIDDENNCIKSICERIKLNEPDFIYKKRCNALIKLPSMNEEINFNDFINKNIQLRIGYKINNKSMLFGRDSNPIIIFDLTKVDEKDKNLIGAVLNNITETRYLFNENDINEEEEKKAGERKEEDEKDKITS